MQQRFELGGAGKIAGCSVKVNIGRQEHLRDDRFPQGTVQILTVFFLIL